MNIIYKSFTFFYKDSPTCLHNTRLILTKALKNSKINKTNYEGL